LCRVLFWVGLLVAEHGDGQATIVCRHEDVLGFCRRHVTVRFCVFMAEARIITVEALLSCEIMPRVSTHTNRVSLVETLTNPRVSESL
jgi:hypothetical protein